MAILRLRDEGWLPLLPTAESIGGEAVLLPAIYNKRMEKRILSYSSYAEADAADAARDAELTPQERLVILIELRNRRHPDAAEQRLARVSRVTKLERR